MGNEVSTSRDEETAAKAERKRRKKNIKKVIHKQQGNTKIFHIALLGNEGCGKTTLAGQFTGNVKFTATSLHSIETETLRKKTRSHKLPRTFKTIIHGNKANLKVLKPIKEEMDDFSTAAMAASRALNRNGKVIKFSDLRYARRKKGFNQKLMYSYVVQLRDIPALDGIVPLSSYALSGDETRRENDVPDLKLTEEEIQASKRTPDNLKYMLSMETKEETRQKEQQGELERRNVNNRGRSPSPGRRRSLSPAGRRGRSPSPSRSSIERTSTEIASDTIVVNSVYLPVEQKLWAYVVMFDARYEASLKYAQAIVNEMRAGILKDDFKNSTIVMFSNKHDIISFATTEEFHVLEKYCAERNVLLVHGSALLGKIHSFGSLENPIRSVKWSWSVEEFFHSVALNMVGHAQHGKGILQKYPLRTFADFSPGKAAQIKDNILAKQNKQKEKEAKASSGALWGICASSR